MCSASLRKEAVKRNPERGRFAALWESARLLVLDHPSPLLLRRWPGRESLRFLPRQGLQVLLSLYISIFVTASETLTVFTLTGPLRPIKCAVRFRPCIDIHKGKVKQIVGTTLRDSMEDGSMITNFESDKSPAEFASLYKHDGLTGGHVIMLGADAASQSAAKQALHAYPGGMQVGGGINSENAMNYLEEGASHVIVTSYVFSDGQMDLERLKHLVRMTGKHRLILDLSCRKKNGKYAIVTDRWQKFSNVFLDEQTLEFLATYADEFLVHGVDVEGKRLGIDEELVALLGCYSPIPVTYAGGVTTIADLERIKTAGKERVDVTVGSALDIFGGDLAYKEVVAWHDKHVMINR